MRTDGRVLRRIAALLMLACLVALGATAARDVRSDGPSIGSSTSVRRTAPDRVAVVNARAEVKSDLAVALRRLSTSTASLAGPAASVALALLAWLTILLLSLTVMWKVRGALPGRRAPPSFVA